MDGLRFDAWSRTLVTAHSRRRLTPLLLGLAVSGPLAVVGLPETAAKHKKHKKKHQRPASPPPASPPAPPPSPPPPPPGPSCRDGVHNGEETDLDCGGPDCPRCANGRQCRSAADCASARCFASQCQACDPQGPAGQCGSDVNGPCGCQASGICTSGVGAQLVATCDECPPSSLGCTCNMFGCFCLGRCGASDSCFLADICQGNTATCGQGGNCFHPLQGLTRCGISAGPASCGCGSDQECAPYGAGAFCVQITGATCSCPGSFTTFCAVPA